MSTLIRSQRRAVQEPQERQAVKGQQYLTFSVTGELFGVAIVSVKEIIEYRATTEVPMMPPPTTTTRACAGRPSALTRARL